MSKRRYGQYCGLARALEIVGDRWAFLVVRDLMVGPRRFSELEEGLPGISTSVLSARLKELEGAGIVRRRVLPRPESGFRYELTGFGRGLEEALVALGRWGARILGEPSPEEIVTHDSMIMALRTIFRPERAGGFRGGYEVRLGEVVLHARIAGGEVEVAAGSFEDADLIIEAGPGIRALFAGEISAEAALVEGVVRVGSGTGASTVGSTESVKGGSAGSSAGASGGGTKGGPAGAWAGAPGRGRKGARELALLEKFAEMFRIEPSPVVPEGGG